MIALNFDDAVAHRAARSAALLELGGERLDVRDRAAASPVTVVTPLPARPLVSRPTRTALGVRTPGAPLGQTHSRTARRQLGHRLPIPVE